MRTIEKAGGRRADSANLTTTRGMWERQIISQIKFVTSSDILTFKFIHEGSRGEINLLSAISYFS